MALQRFAQNPIGIQKDIEKIDKSRNRFFIFMIVKEHGSGMGDSMIIKKDEIKAEMVNYIKRNMTITLTQKKKGKKGKNRQQRNPKQKVKHLLHFCRHRNHHHYLHLCRLQQNVQTESTCFAFKR